MASKRRSKAEPSRALAPVVPIGARPPMGRQMFAASPRTRSRNRVVGITPEQLASALDRARMGEFELLADVFEQMLTTDPHVRSVTDTALRSISGSEMRFRPADDARDAVLAQAAADFAADSFARVQRMELTISNTIMAALVGLAVAEHDWQRDGREVHSVAQHWVQPRDLRISDAWTPLVRTYPRNEGGVQTGWEWLSVEEEPARWLVHVFAQPGLTSNVAGLLWPCAWPWLWKRIAEVWGMEALERFASPLIYGRMEPNANDVARTAFFNGLQQLSADHVAVIEQDQSIEIVQPTTNPQDTYDTAIARYNAEITKAILGSTLNVEVGSTGGNRALGESQAETTILPRLRAIAASAESAIRATWLQPLIAFNAVSFGGRIPPTPHVEFVLETETPPVITQLHVDAGVVRKNELRLAAGLDPLDGPEGERFVQPLAKVQTPSFFSDDRPAPRVEGGDVPLAKAPRAPRRRPHQLTLPTSPTFSRCPTQVAALPFDASGDPER
jgi:phage gp29-like protein